MLWHLRAPKHSDAPFLFNSFLKSFRDAGSMANLTHTVYYREMHRCIEEVFQSPNARVVIAHQPDEDDVIFGYGVGEVVGNVFVIHFIYTKHSFRSFGIGKMIEAELLKNPHSRVEFSTWPKMSKILLKGRDYVYNPFRLLSKSTEIK